MMRALAFALLFASLLPGCVVEVMPSEDAGADVSSMDAAPIDAAVDAGVDAPVDALTPRREGACTDGSECTSGICRAGACAMPCERATDCPTTRGWACSPGEAGRSGCTCEPSTAADPCSDNVDTDCDGALECLVCDGDEVRLDDASNCGACGRACPAGARCAAAVCTCDDAARSPCGTTCVDTSTDEAHCGGCDVVCPLGATCEEGSCVCPSGSSAVCDGVCVDTSNDVAHCGGCDLACGDGERCSGGACACPEAGRSSCPGAGCVDLSRDPLHCGACTTACPIGAACELGTCTCAADRPTACGVACVDTTTDTAHCGACGRACPPGVDCVAGVCACPGVTTACGASCVDLESDRANCGACGRTCSGWCMGGGCIEPRSIGVGDGFACVLLRDGRVLCWGAGRSGKLGDGSEVLSRAHPEAVLDVDDATFLSVGSEAACVIRPGGELWCWGDHLGSTGRSNRPVQVDDIGRPIVHVSVGITRSCAVTDDGAAHCWGEYPGRFTVPGGFVQIATGESHTCGLTSTRAVYCWGWNTHGQLGQGTSGVGMYFPDPIVVAGMPATGVEIDAGRDHTCVRTSTRDVWCWGADWVWQASAGGPGGRDVRSPTSIGASVTAWSGVWTEMDTGAWDTTCTVMGSGTLLVFGDVTPSGTSISDATACSVGRSHGCALRRGNLVSCWGTNVLGELGGGTTAYASDTPVTVRW